MTSTKAESLRSKAELCRIAANVKTNGGHLEDQILLHIADYLEREADAIENKNADDPTDSSKYKINIPKPS